MGKYQLVGVYYDDSTKKISNEKQLISKKARLSNLISIDRFTSSRDGVSLWRELAKYNDISDINTLVLKYNRDKDSKPTYMPVIIDNKYLLSATYNCKSRKSRYNNKTFHYFINHKSTKFHEVCERFFYLLFSFRYKSNKESESKEYKKHMDRLVKNCSDLKKYVDWCLGVDLMVEEDFGWLKEELSKYKTFRNVLVGEMAYSNRWISSYDCYQDYIKNKDLFLGDKDELNNSDDVEKNIDDNLSNDDFDDDLGHNLPSDTVKEAKEDNSIVKTYLVCDGETVASVYIEHEDRPSSKKRRR